MVSQALDDQIKELELKVSSHTPTELDSLEEFMRKAEAWTDECALAHIRYIPRDLLVHIFYKMEGGKDAVRELLGGLAVIVEYLPVEKQARVRSGLDAGLIQTRSVPGYSRTLARAPDATGFWKVRRATLRDVLRGAPLR